MVIVLYSFKHKQPTKWWVVYGGERGIRTPETFDSLLAFQASALDHYAISPRQTLFRAFGFS